MKAQVSLKTGKNTKAIAEALIDEAKNGLPKVKVDVYPAGEKVDKHYDKKNFAKLIAKKSKVQVITVEDEKDLRKFFKKNLISNELILCMGAGSISKWIREMKL